jgi:hypothetical protein
MNEVELLIEFAKSWNNLDVLYIDYILDDDMEYTSQWVIETLYGKKNYLKYLDGKFKTIRNRINLPKADLGYYTFANGEENKPCLVITQGDVKVAILTEILNGKISKINMVGIPLPNNAILLNIIPK